MGKFARDPFLLQNILKRPNRALNRTLLKYRYDEFDVMDADWDNLIILDACRYDALIGQEILNGNLSCIISKGGNSWEFVKKTFGERELFDTIYISSNIHFEKLDNKVFYHVERLLGEKNRESPERLRKKTIEISKEYPNKRLITHFIIPHTPYLNKKAKKLRCKISNNYDVRFRPDVPETNPDPEEWDLYNLKNAREKGYISDNELREVYYTDVEIGLQHAADLVESLNGKSVITADHGEMLGERLPPLYIKEYGHIGNVYCDELRCVPWLEVDYKERRKIYAEDPVDYKKVDDESINEQLEALGYR